ncbi:MAG: hypothetical protein AAF791_08490, partial [Bacteroidota bacterium]
MRACVLRLCGLLALAACEAPPPPQSTTRGTEAVSPSADTTARPVFRTREWTIDDGLPTPVESIAQTPDGYLWMATSDGLARFDGHRFVVFTTETTPLFRSHLFLAVDVLPSGDLWVGTRDRWAYRLRDGEWSAYSLDDAFSGEHWIQGFEEDAEGTVWAVSTGPYLARFDGEAWTRHTDRLELSWPAFTADAQGVLWSKLHAGEAPDVPTAPIGGDLVARLVGTRFEPVIQEGLIGMAATQYGPLLHVREEPSSAPGDRFRVTLTDAEGEALTWIWFDDITERAMLVDRAGRAWVQLSDAEGQNELAVVKDGEEMARFRPEGATWFEDVYEDRQGAIWTFSTSTGLIQITEDPFRRFTT